MMEENERNTNSIIYVTKVELVKLLASNGFKTFAVEPHKTPHRTNTQRTHAICDLTLKHLLANASYDTS